MSDNADVAFGRTVVETATVGVLASLYPVRLSFYCLTYLRVYQKET
jgi:hypothetical protein